jgi:hypothetical protein
MRRSLPCSFHVVRLIADLEDGVRDSYAIRAVYLRHSAVVLRRVHRAIEGSRQQL